MKRTIDKTLIEENEARTQMDGIELYTNNDTITLKLMMITVLILFNCILYLCCQMMKAACSSFPVIQKSLLIGRTSFGSSLSIHITLLFLIYAIELCIMVLPNQREIQSQFLWTHLPITRMTT